MPKNIILLSDGTGNSAASPFKTNVWRIYQALDLTTDRPESQIAYYDDGVGTSALSPLALIGGALGIGLKRNVKHLYKCLCQSYEPGDRIYAFGFSRGAFTIRVLTGLIASQGVIAGRDMDPRELRRRVDEAYDHGRGDYETHWGKLWRILRGGSAAKATTTTDAPEIPAGHQNVEITFLGLWDTVDAYGLPVDELKRGLDYWMLGLSFPDQNMSLVVKRAAHALALDDKRRTFHPVLWNEKFEADLLARGIINEPRLKQVWFAGMHANVGGGYAKDGLAYVPLNWILQEAQAADPTLPLRFHAPALQDIRNLANAHAEMGNSRGGLASYYRYDPRRVSTLCDDNYNRVWIKPPKIHHTVFDRIKAQIVTYIPHMVPAAYDVVGPNGKIVPNPYETPIQASQRNDDLERAWDLVWWRRLVYLLTIFLSAVLVLFPWIWDTAEVPACTGFWCFIGPVIAAVAAFLPSWADTWFKAFELHPGTFMALALVLGAVMWFGSWLERRIEARATEAWSPLSGIKPANGGHWGALSQIARTARTTGWLVAAYRWFAREFLPFVCFIVIVAAGVVLVNKAAFEAVEAFGGTCQPTATLKSAGQAKVPVGTFNVKDVCYATGVELLEGRTYVIEFRASLAWEDGSVLTWPDGFNSAKGGWLFRLAAPIRRTWFARWFEPIGRIGVLGRDRYDLSPRYESELKDDKGEIMKDAAGRPIYVFASKQFIAHNTGELFLFANDAVLALPRVWLDDRQRWWSWFYDNNKGSADVIIRVSAPPASAPPPTQ